MQDVLFVEVAEQAGALLHPLRVQVLRRLAEPRSCPELAKELSETAQKIYYHVKILESSGLIEKVDERRVRGIVEGIYRARAKSYWLSPALVGRIGGKERARDRLSLDYVLTLAEEIQNDVGRLGERTPEEEVPSLGLSFQIELPDGRTRRRFLEELQETFKNLARKYGGNSEAEGERFQVSLVCYPRRAEPGARAEGERSESRSESAGGGAPAP
jgi:DNA-binding transcriptional ArsR family regulator